MRLLVGVNGSERALGGLEEVVDRARQAGDELTVAVYSSDDAVAATEEAVRDRLETLDVDATVETVTGQPGSRLVELAETDDYDRIVLSGGQTSPLGKIQFDSVIEFVLLNAHTTVTLIR
ncbi:Universal stress protein family protein [Halovenus aranensis]|jgi:nucleotide-binding universal stress UspA family protein|uniref:Universal stress protein family protein n=1 Tax=Halovenus aranensis TaxID=890420 RepID=A0A1G8RP29_9EURY|nr:universal stress protein [Halovenus aranensis]SDJ18706.1 Universal stress protein family protein [Halovenus aranensis]